MTRLSRAALARLGVDAPQDAAPCVSRTDSGARSVLDAHLSEDAFMRSITDLCDVLNLPWYHARNPEQDNAGWPDLAIADWRHRTFRLWELKTMAGRVRKEQEIWLAAIAQCDRFEAGLYRPNQWSEIEELLG